MFLKKPSAAPQIKQTMASDKKPISKLFNDDEEEEDEDEGFNFKPKAKVPEIKQTPSPQKLPPPIFKLPEVKQ